MFLYFWCDWVVTRDPTYAGLFATQAMFFLFYAILNYQALNELWSDETALYTELRRLFIKHNKKCKTTKGKQTRVLGFWMWTRIFGGLNWAMKNLECIEKTEPADCDKLRKKINEYNTRFKIQGDTLEERIQYLAEEEEKEKHSGRHVKRQQWLLHWQETLNRCSAILCHITFTTFLANLGLRFDKRIASFAYLIGELALVVFVFWLKYAKKAKGVSPIRR